MVKSIYKKIGVGICCAMSTVAMADPVISINGNNNQSAAVVNAVQSLGGEMQAIAVAAMSDVNNMVYEVDSFFPTTPAAANSPAILQATQQKTANLTQNQITSALLQWPINAGLVNQFTNPVMVAKIKENQQLIPNLTQNTPASDTLIDQSSSASVLANDLLHALNAATDQKHDEYFNFDSLLTPPTYSLGQQIAAERFLQYLSQNYQSLVSGIDFGALKNKLNSFNDSDDRAKWLTTLLSNPAFQQYQLAIRSSLAARSVAMSNFNLLLAQRLPQKDLNGESLLQAQSDTINQRINNPAWYQAMQTASPSTVAREQLLLTAALVQQLQQQQMYSQRLLATMSLLSLQMGNATNLTLQAQAQQVNSLFGGGQKNNSQQ